MTVTINGTTGIAGVDGSAATPAVQGADTDTGIFFPAADTIAFAEGGTEVMRINSSGYVGIGTTSPIQPLTVESTSNLRLAIRNSTETVAYSASVDFATGSGSLSSTNIVGRVIGLITQADPSTLQGALTFQTNSGDAVSEKMRIDSSGNLLIGKTSTLNTVAGSLITSTGSTSFSTDAASPSDGPSLQVVNINATVVNGYRFASFRIGASATEIGTITKASATTVAYNTSSDYRLKENVQPMQNALAIISALKPSTYDWIGHSESGEGFIAHELQEIIPIAVTGVKDAVNEDGSIKPQGVDYSKIVVHLVAAIQEQQAMITALTARITALEATP